MTNDVRMTWRLIGIFFLGCVLLSYPVLTMFNVKVILFGFPVLYLYIFIIWMIIILFIYRVSKMHTKKGKKNSEDPFLIPTPKE